MGSEARSSPDGRPPAPREVLGLRDAVALIVGVVVGAGIFKAPSMVAQMTGQADMMFGAWLLGGLNAAWIGVAVLLIGVLLLLVISHSSFASLFHPFVSTEAIRRNR